MSTPTSPHRSAGNAEWTIAAADRRSIPARRTWFGTVLDAAARVGSVVTLAALLVVTGMLVTMLDTPVPTAAATAGR